MAENETWGSVISVYTRAQALEDGVLIDGSSVAREAGIKFPVAITEAVYCECVNIPAGYTGPDDEKGRLWDVVHCLRIAVACARRGADVVKYELRVGGRLKNLWAKCGPGDNLEPVITVMMEGED